MKRNELIAAELIAEDWFNNNNVFHYAQWHDKHVIIEYDNKWKFYLISDMLMADRCLQLKGISLPFEGYTTKVGEVFNIIIQSDSEYKSLKICDEILSPYLQGVCKIIKG